MIVASVNVPILASFVRYPNPTMKAFLVLERDLVAACVLVEVRVRHGKVGKEPRQGEGLLWVASSEVWEVGPESKCEWWQSRTAVSLVKSSERCICNSSNLAYRAYRRFSGGRNRPVQFCCCPR